MEVKNFDTPSTFKCANGNTLEISHCVVDESLIESFKNENKKVKFIFFDEKYSKFSFDPTIREIHKFKSKYPGNSYIRIPISIFPLSDKIHFYINNVDKGNESDGFVVVSKLDLINDNKRLRTAKKEIKEQEGIKLCLAKMVEYRDVLSGNIYRVNETDSEGNVISEKTVFGRIELQELIKDHVFTNSDNEYSHVCLSMLNESFVGNNV